MTEKANILIIDDEETIRDSCSQALRKDGYTVKTAQDGSEGLELFKKELFHAVLLDLKLPGIDGIQVLGELKQENPDTPVIIITGYASVESAVETMRLGAFDYMTKPFNDNELRARVRVAERIVRIQSSLARTVEELRQALDLVDTLQGSISVCSSCGLIEGDDGSWHRVSDFTDDKYDPRFTPVLCPYCTEDKE